MSRHCSSVAGSDSGSGRQAVSASDSLALPQRLYYYCLLNGIFMIRVMKAGYMIWELEHETVPHSEI